MFEYVLFVLVTLVTLFAPLALLPTAGLWAWRNGRLLPRVRRITFIVGLGASVFAYAMSFVVDLYIHYAYPGGSFWPEDRVMSHVAVLMVATAFLGFAAGCFGRGYGRVAECIACALIALNWYIVAIATF